MGDTHVPLRRVLLPWVTGATLLVLTAVAVWRVAASRDDMVERERARLQANVEAAVEEWEDALVDELSAEIDNVAALDLDRLAERERKLRSTKFAAIYVWTAPVNPQMDPPRMLFPVTNAGRVDVILRASPCLANAAETFELYPDNLGGALRAWRTCRNEDPNVQLRATSQAAYALQYAGKYDAAREEIERTDLALAAIERVPGASGLLTLQGAARRGIAPFGLTAIRLQRAELLLDVGRMDDALALLRELGVQIAMLGAPDYATIKPVFAVEILDELQEHGPRDLADAVRRGFEASDRRLRAYKEIAERILPTASAARVGESPRFIYDQYSDHPFVLFYGWSNSSLPAVGVGLQLEQTALLGSFVRKLGRIRDFVTITDASGQPVFGKHREGEDAVVVQFTRTLAHLRVHVGRKALDQELDDDPWAGMTLIAFCLVLGLIALAGQVQANRKLADLLDRQRAFTTRVTHELKTPLAGIRVMAENLENGAFRDEDQRSEMATRIVGEVDRLTSRVDEVLAVARERTIPSPRPFDPEEVLLGLVEEWGPRFAVEGVELHADLATTDPINGDGSAFRDAVGCLLDNALKYRRQDGRARPQVWLDLAQQGRRVLVAVTDNGLGVPRLMRKAIFGRFVRVEGDNRGRSGGHGLGLHQVREIVRAHKGAVTCTEGVDGGSKFEIVLNALTPR
jgi:signal transduction histidine kinase